MKHPWFIVFILIILLANRPGTAMGADPDGSSQKVKPEISASQETAQEELVEKIDQFESAIFDDETLLKGYAAKYVEEPKDILLAMVNDDTLDDYKMAAAVRVLREKYGSEIFSREKKIIEKQLLRRLNRTDSPFVQVEIMHTLTLLDRYRYFPSMAPALILKIDHYNSTLGVLSYNALDDIIKKGSNKAREARIIFNTLRKVLFLSRKRLADVTTPDEKLSQKLKLLRWSIKVLGTQELNRLPNEVLNLL